MKRVGVDVGGTFTDLIYVDDEAGVIRVHKLPTTPEDPSQGTVQGIREISEAAGQSPAALDQVFHGTTIATNIVIEHNGAKVGMLTSEGYRDILHIARHKKPLNFSNYQDLPWQRYPVVRRRYRLTVAERILGLRREVQQLEILLPICSYCRRIRNDNEQWKSLEAYIEQHFDTQFSHSICPDCYTKHVQPQLDRGGGQAL